jgi:DNA-binding MarR family transcriptional regulator
VTTARWLHADEDRAWRGWLAMAERLHSQLASDLLADAGLSYADYQVLVHLSEAPDLRVRMSDLASRLDWSKSRASHQVARMEGRGLVRKEDCRSDARGAFAVLTDAGIEQIRAAAPGHVESVRRHFIDLLDSQDLNALCTISTRVLEHLRSQSACAAASADGTDAVGCGGAEPGEGDTGPQG